MPNLPTYITKITVATAILTHFLFYLETAAQESDVLTSPSKQCWKLETNKMTSHKLASDNEGNGYLSFLNGKIESIILKTGKKNWGSELRGEIILSPLPDNKSIFIISKIKTKILLYSLSKDSGITNWQASFDFNEDVFFIKDSNKLVICSRSGKIFVINKETGAEIWSRNLEQKLSTTPILFEDNIVFGTMDKKIFFYSIETGDTLSQFDVPFSPNIASIVKNKYLFWSDHRGNAYLSSLITKKIIWKMRGGAEISHIFDTQQGLLISSLDNFIYLISAEKGKLIWKKRFYGRLLFNPTIVGDNAIIVTFASESVDIIDIKSGKLVSQFVVEGDDYFINTPLIFNDLFIFPTLKGVIGLTNSRLGCALK